MLQLYAVASDGIRRHPTASDWSDNAETGCAFGNFRNFTDAQIHEIVSGWSEKCGKEPPEDQPADHLGNTLMLVRRRCSVRKPERTEIQTRKYLDYLIGSV